MKTFSTTIIAIFSLVCVAHVFAAAGEYDAALPESVSETVQEAVETVSEKAPAILDGFRRSILSNWRRLSGKCADLIALHDEMPDLPEDAWLHKDRRGQRKRIRKQLEQIRALLLSTDARKILAAVYSFDAKIAEIDDDIRETRDKKFQNPGKEAKFAAKIAKLEARRNAFVERRAEAARAVLAELRAIGLRLSGDAAEKCIFTVNVGDLIDTTIVAKHVGLVVEALGKQIHEHGGDVVAAKRYYGMYVAMLEVQKMCFDDYLEKSRNGPWSRQLEAIRKEATEQRDEALRAAEDSTYELSQQAVFRNNAEKFERMLRAVDAYEEILIVHQGVIDLKAYEAERMLAVARSSLATVTLAGDFLSLVQTAEDSFDALLQLELPPLELFNDEALQSEFSKLTERLK